MKGRIFKNRMKSQIFKNKDGKRRRGVHLIPNILTTGNLFSGLAAVVFVFHGKFEAAAIAILIAMIFDVLDGTSARLTDSTSEFGVEYDSLSDLISFGLAPGFLIYAWALKSPGMLSAATCLGAMGEVSRLILSQVSVIRLVVLRNMPPPLPACFPCRFATEPMPRKLSVRLTGWRILIYDPV